MLLSVTLDVINDDDARLPDTEDDVNKLDASDDSEDEGDGMLVTDNECEKVGRR